MAKERVQKILARAGIASRRNAEKLIADGSVTINGQVAKLGDQAEYGKDSIKVSGKLIHSTEALAYLVFHKPKGVISMFGDPEGRPSLTDYLTAVKYRLFPIGRLDFNSEGLILLTNDGAYAEKIQRKNDIIRVYHVKVSKHPTPEDLVRLEKGGRVGQRMFVPHSIRLAQEFTKKALVEVSVVGSGAVDLKAFFELKGMLVERVIRVAFGHLRLSGTELGKFKYLKSTQAMALLEQPELGMRRQEFEAEKAKKREPRAEREEREAREAPPSRKPKIVPKKRIGAVTKSTDSRYGVFQGRSEDRRPAPRSAQTTRPEPAARREPASRIAKPFRREPALRHESDPRPSRSPSRPSRILIKKRDR